MSMVWPTLGSRTAKEQNRVRLVFVCLFVKVQLVFCVFSVGLDRFVFVLFKLLVLGLASSVLGQEIGWEEHLRDDIFVSSGTCRTSAQSIDQPVIIIIIIIIYIPTGRN